jgi:hypothetical protein
MKITTITEAYPDETFLQADGFDEAIIGIEANSMRIVYSVSKCIEILIKEGMTHEDALEHFNFNVRGSYVGEQTPIYVDDECLDLEN